MWDRILLTRIECLERENIEDATYTVHQYKLIRILEEKVKELEARIAKLEQKEE